MCRPTPTTDLLSPDRVALMRKWLSDCERSHPLCNDNAFQYNYLRRPAKRFIEVGEPGQTAAIRLIEMDGSYPQKPYAALSYCWGPSSINYTTTASRLEQHKRQIPWDKLPKTIQEAIIVTQLLGIPYLWVDALCIVQWSRVEAHGQTVVNNGDWAEESTKMGSVYRDARVTLAAVSSSRSDQGFIRGVANRDLPKDLVGSFGESQALTNTPHAKRGWTFQEIFLSTRIIHFYEGWMVWECRAAKGVEGSELHDSTNGWDVSATRDVVHYSVPNANQLVWWSWVRNYTARSLTCISDRAIAMHGLVDHYSFRTKDERVTGLWKRNLPKDLLWRAVKPGRRIRSDPKMPTWSWMSIDSVIAPPRNVDLANCVFVPVAEVDIPFEGMALVCTSDKTSWIGSSKLTLKGRLQDALVCKERDSPTGPQSSGSLSWTYQLRVVVNGELQELQHCWIDCEDEIPADGKVDCFWVGMQYGLPEMEQYATREALIVVPADGCGVYRRIGCCKVRAEKAYKGPFITRRGSPSPDGTSIGLKLAAIDKENARIMGFLDEDVTITLI